MKANIKKKYPPIGTVSHGTMREEDLIPAFMGVLEEYDPKLAKQIREENKDIFDWLDNPQGEEMPAFTDEFLNEILWDAMDSIAAPGVYFGSTEGDGCDYGYWKEEPEKD